MQNLKPYNEQMHMEVYGKKDRLFAVLGNTKPYAKQLRALGGEYRKFLLYGEPGWLFGVEDRANVSEFIRLANQKGTHITTPKEHKKVNPVTVNFPNIFEDTDMLSQQIIMYTAPIPTLEQHLILTVGEINIEYVITDILKTTAPFDDILITQALENTGTKSRAIIMNGTWQIHCMQDDHTITFLKL